MPLPTTSPYTAKPLRSTAQSKPVSDQLAYSVQRFLTNVLSQIGNLDGVPVDTYLDMLYYHPVIGTGFQIKILLALSMWGDYNHDDEKIQAFVRKNFAQMNGTIEQAVAEMFLAAAIGYSFSEKNYVQVGREWHLDSILAVDPRRYRFEGMSGEVINIKYYSYGQKGTIDIPYEKGVHIVNMPYLAIGRDPYGVSELRRVVAVWEGWKILMGELMVAGQRQATPIIVMKVNTNDSYTLFDDYGQPILDPVSGQPIRIPAADRALEQIEGLENRSVMVTDLINEVNTLNQEGRDPGGFFLNALRYLERLALLGLVIPETTLSTGITGTGDSGLNSGHMELMLTAIGALVDQIKQQMIEGPVRDLIEWNYGMQDDYGNFDKPEADTTDRVALLAAISNAVMNGLFSDQDLDVVNRAHELVGLPPLKAIIQKLQPPAPEPPTEPDTEDLPPEGKEPVKNGNKPPSKTPAKVPSKTPAKVPRKTPAKTN